MSKRIKLYFTILSILLITAIGCKKGTFDINSPNPNSPSDVSPQFSLSEALVASAYSNYAGGFTDFANLYSGYWSFSGDYGGYGPTATYNITNSYGDGNWDYVYNTILVNYKLIEKKSATDPTLANYLGMAKIMEAFHFQRLVDIYNNIPYSQALQGGTINYPAYDDAKSVYTSIINQVDSGLAAIAAAPGDAQNPGAYDVMFGGHMDKWTKFGNTVKLKILLNLTQTSDGPALATSELAGLTPDDFLAAGEDAAVNPGYSNSSGAQQNPQWQNVGFTTGNADQGDHDFYRANSYAVNFYLNTNDYRASRFYALNNDGVVRGRAFGSQDGTEHNAIISAVGPGILQSPSMKANLLPAFESLFFQSEAVQRGYLTNADPQGLYESAVTESYRLLFANIANYDYEDSAATYVGQANAKTSWTTATDKMTLILTQEWAALNMYDPITAWNNWKRLNIPSDLPISIYPGTVAPHAPIRLIYPTSEYSSNAANVGVEGTIDPISSKIFWMP